MQVSKTPTELVGSAPNGATAGAVRGPDGAGRAITRRRGLPSGRAVVGGFLVALAAVGTFAAYTAGTAAPTTRYVVAARDLGAGEVLTLDALTLVAMELPDEQRSRSFDLPEVLDGAVTLAPLAVGELIQGSAVTAADDAPPARIVSFAADPARALGGRIRPGERVDIVATYGEGAQAYTELVLGDVRVLTADAAGGDDLGGTTVGFTVEVADRSQELALVHATTVAAISVVRSTGVPAGPSDLPGPFQAQPPPELPAPSELADAPITGG